MAGPTWTARAPQQRNSRASSPVMMPPMPTTGMRTARASSWTMRSATGLMAGPERPPLPAARRGRRASRSIAVARRVLMAGSASAPSVSAARPTRVLSPPAGLLRADRGAHAARRLRQAGRRLPGRGPEREPFHGERAERAQVDQPGELGPVAEGAGGRDDGVRQPDRADRDARVDAGARAHRLPSRSSITIASWPGP